MYRHFRWRIVSVTSSLAIALALFWYYHDDPEAARPATPEAFLQQHWQLPIPPQGAAPAHFSSLEASLHPADCGVCHPQQWQDWQQSVHSRSMGPGVYGQLLDMELSDPAGYTACATCHTPLSEQLPMLQQGQTYHPNPAFDARLRQAGLVCAACHVRQHQRFGPPRGAENPLPAAGTAVPHGGFTEAPAFQRAEFCRECHQFTPEAFALNGKLLENTYEEWRASPYAREGVQCQQCHMPERRHLWRGIHDPDMVRQAITVTVTPEQLSYTPGSSLHAMITLTNSGAGHFLPTYVTPKIFLQVALVDAQGTRIAHTQREIVIGREVALDLSEEIYDTRIPPQAAQTLPYRQVVPAEAAALQVRVVVHPQHFYERFFTATLVEEPGPGHPHLQRALQAARTAPFTAFEREIPLQGAAQHQ